jgi:hypothetical protein
MTTKLKAGDWTIEVDGDYVYLRFNNQEGKIQVKSDLEGFAVDIFDSTLGEPVSSCYALYEDLDVFPL